MGKPSEKPSLPYQILLERKQRLRGLAKYVGLQLQQSMQHDLATETKKKLDLVRDFFLEKDIVYTAPGLKDFITIHEGGEKLRLRKHYLTMYLREAHSIFKTRHPDVTISFTAFCKLRPKNVLLLKDTQLDQCKCQIHENFIFKLSALKINYHNNFWGNVLCEDESENLISPCWNGECHECSNGRRIVFNQPPSDVTYNEWIVDDEFNQRSIEKTCPSRLLQSLVIQDLPKVQQHVQLKRILEASFQTVKAKSNIGITQIDFAMAYSCEYQNEIQSALWASASINLFTLARFVNQEVFCHLFVLDDYKKDKDVIAACLLKFYTNDTIFPNEFLYSDGPSSEFKNRFMMKLLHNLSNQHSTTFTWNFFATGHGKGVVDGIGGQAKSLVRQQILLKYAKRLCLLYVCTS